MSIVKRDYMLLANSVSPDFGSEGWSDGYNDLPNDSENIVVHLYGKISNVRIIECVNLYLQGYELGTYMSENIEKIYDEDGFINDDLDLSPVFDYTEEAVEYVKRYIKKINVNL